MKKIPIEKLHPFENHPYKVLENEELEQLAQSIKQNGILSPLIVRPIEATDEYEVISGHRRLHAARKAGAEQVPASIHVMDRNAAAIMLVDSNLHREHILPSEKAFAYKMKAEAMKHQGVTCGQVGHKSRDDVSETESGRTVQRYIRLTYLISEFLDKMDEGNMALSVGVELSYLDETTQREILEQCERNDCTPSHAQSIRMKKLSQAGKLDDEAIFSIMEDPKANQKEKIVFRYEELRPLFPQGYTANAIYKAILGLIFTEKHRWEKAQNRRSYRDER